MGIMSGAANDRWREAQKECEILRRANDDYIKTATEQCLRIAALETENKAIRLLHRVEIEGRLARITALEAELARLRAELAAVKTDLGRQCQMAEAAKEGNK